MVNIIGSCPVKIFTQGVIYIPKAFWKYYGINYDRDEIIREDKSNSVIIRKYEKRELKANESVKSVFLGKTNVNPLRIRMNELKAGDTLWLTGTEKGMILTVGEFHSTVR